MQTTILVQTANSRKGNIAAEKTIKTRMTAMAKTNFAMQTPTVVTARILPTTLVPMTCMTMTNEQEPCYSCPTAPRPSTTIPKTLTLNLKTRNISKALHSQIAEALNLQIQDSRGRRRSSCLVISIQGTLWLGFRAPRVR